VLCAKQGPDGKVLLWWDGSWSALLAMMFKGAVGAGVAIFAICAGVQSLHVLFEGIAKSEVRQALFPIEGESALVTAGQLKSGKLHQPLACLHIPFPPSV
jgi:hypothetical protein